MTLLYVSVAGPVALQLPVSVPHMSWLKYIETITMRIYLFIIIFVYLIN